jgi:thiol-disulfide isomerase/thioredoxin
VRLAAKDTVIENPAYEFNTSGINNISRIELGENETRVYVHTEFIPGWWVRFSKQSYLEDCATGKKWYVTDIRKGEFDKKIPMPASGDSTFILVFPKLDKSVVKINYCEEDENDRSLIYGISLNPKAKHRTAKNAVPYGVQKWIDRELAKAKRKTLMNFDAGEFFSGDTARLIGYIKGYDKRAGFSSGIIYTSNEITRQDHPRVVRIFPDGRFECLLPVKYPQNENVYFKNRSIGFYIQPGTTLAMILDWEEFRTADRLRNIRYRFSDIQFEGATASVNKELTEFNAKYEALPYQQIYDEMQKKEPDEYKTRLDELVSKYSEACRQAVADKNMSALAKSIIQNEYAVDYAGFLMDYAMNYSDRREKQAPLPVEFYGFLKDVPLNSRQILTGDGFSTFINRLEYSSVFADRYQRREPEKTLKQYLYEELGLPQTPEDLKYFNLSDSLVRQLRSDTITSGEQQKIIARLNEEGEVFNKRYEQQIADYSKKYLPNPDPYETVIKEWHIIDSIYANVLKLKPGLVSDIIKTRQLKYMYGQRLKDDSENARKISAYLKNSLHENFLKQESEDVFNRYFSPDRQTAYELPETEDALAFKKIIGQFRGKYILVDFWSTWCGPCIYGIKESKAMRESYKDSRDVAFVYITSEDESPADKYEQFVREQNMTNSFRVSDLDYQYFRQLFTFNGIPHYEVIDREGRVLKNVNTYDFENNLKKWLENERGKP